MVDVDLLGDRQLRLEHKVKNGIMLEEASRDATLRHIRTLWGYEVSLAAIDAQPLEDTECVRVDLWSIDLYLADADDGTVADLGAVLVISWPRLAMPIEILHAVLSSLFGQTLPVTQLLGRPIIVPVVRERMRRTGAQLHALQGWLFGEDDV